ncbi:MAG: 2-oxoglutaramate amidase [Gammaproteobacteria bacterium]|nr:2-oxoglutaramate amidase [Gammaproteobacteria bacterium]
MCSSDILAENLKNAAQFIEEAANHGAKLIVLPEMFALMRVDSSDEINIKKKVNPSEIQVFLSEQSQKYKVWIVGGTLPLVNDASNKMRATSLVYDDRGSIVARYDKIHLFDVKISDTEIYQESKTIEAGKEVVIVQTPFGKLGLSVCYDIRFPELFRCLVNKGAEIIIIPAAFTVETGQAHWELLARSRAIENLCYIVGACQGGMHSNGRKTYGHSIIVEPWGSVIAQKIDDVPGIIYATIDLDYQQKLRKSFAVLQHRKIF